ncbi:MAG: histone deacetylase family protein [Comamonadaceae bacterium]|jgi:acetoin utilization deacetylase AcuC-like enzyme|uniref:histone deacetylase family protein n=1 Tax=Candidatus Skiveiella danica TaxID=3386177 RepID=UPI001B6B6385|nr:histone deacetylase family protein [Comamonadaceae bacterium]MBP6319865.1 histone deacetylase family protein [Rubrivivax sp.]MBP6465211.1 histone deacetylase family protein [Rubrivivax sp.]
MGKTGYYTHRDCWKHDMGGGHPECPERLDAIEDRLLVTGVGDALERGDVPLATLAQITRAHTEAHLEHLEELSQRLVADEPAGGPSHAMVDPDTSLMRYTVLAARRAAGAAIAATDAVMAGDIENAFCAVRPPGHHACREQAMGFCFLNNVAIAARHALDAHGLERVAVVDFDVHHGNGTENILSGDPRVLMVGIFQHPFYPYGDVDHPAANMLNLPVPAYTKGMDVRELIEMMWMPRLEEFKPQMIFISAGFDAHRDDDLGQLRLNENDFAWITDRVRDVAKRHAHGRIVSMLEGGYNLDALARSVEAHVRVLADL